MKRRSWQDSEIAVLKREYPHRPTNEVAQLLGRPITRVYQKANLIGLKKSPEYMAQEILRQGDRLRKGRVANRFKKGQKAHNKGKKMDPQTYEKVKKTFFPKGHEPSNTNYDGHERISKDGYVEVRVRIGKYRLKHLHQWEQVNGKLAKGYCLRCIDGNKLNTDSVNWQLISRADNMRMNTIHRFPEEVKELIRLQKRVKIAIKKRAKNEE